MTKLAATQWVIDSGVFGQLWSGRSDSITIDVASSGVTLDILRDALNDAACLQEKQYVFAASVSVGELAVPKHSSLAVACKRNDHSTVAVRKCHSLTATIAVDGGVVVRLQATEVGGKISALLSTKNRVRALMGSFHSAIAARKAEAVLAAGPSTPAPVEDDEHTRDTWRPTAPPTRTSIRPMFDSSRGFVSISAQ